MPMVQSKLLRRLVGSRNDPAKQRVLSWLKDIDDERLSAFGFTSEDIAALRVPSALAPRPCSLAPGMGIGRRREGLAEGMRRVRLGSGFGTE
jgi:hypothetical protein